jgi:hypothetical protein
MTSGPIRRGRHEPVDIAGEMGVPTRSDFSRIAVINLILRNARSHLRDDHIAPCEPGVRRAARPRWSIGSSETAKARPSR